MIRINLNPKEELESQVWFLPDLLVLLLVFMVAYSFVEGELAKVQDDIAQTIASRDDFNERTKKIQPELEKFKNLGKDKENLLVKLRALQAITGSRISKFKPLIAIEHLQNLKPESVWLTNLNADDAQLSFEAMALDNILVAEFITALKSTQFQDIDPADLRTQVYFSNVSLSGTTSVAAPVSVEPGRGDSSVRFKLTVSIGERLPPDPAVGSKQARDTSSDSREGRRWM
jgi:hypothetical protein